MSKLMFVDARDVRNALLQYSWILESDDPRSSLRCYTITSNAISSAARNDAYFKGDAFTGGIMIKPIAQKLRIEYVVKRWVPPTKAQAQQHDDNSWNLELSPDPPFKLDDYIFDSPNSKNYSRYEPRLQNILSLDGEPLGEKIKMQIEMCRKRNKSISVDLGEQNFVATVVCHCSVLLKSTNRKPISDPKAKIVVQVKVKTWNENRNNYTLRYDTEQNALYYTDGSRFSCVNEPAVLEFIQSKVSSLG